MGVGCTWVVMHSGDEKSWSPSDILAVILSGKVPLVEMIIIKLSNERLFLSTEKILVFQSFHCKLSAKACHLSLLQFIIPITRACSSLFIYSCDLMPITPVYRNNSKI